MCYTFCIVLNVHVCVPGKAVVSMPVGGPAVMNNYMIAQPPGFQLATFVSAAVWTYYRSSTVYQNQYS